MATRTAPIEATRHREGFARRVLADLRTFLRFPTVSAAGETRHFDRCAIWLRDHLRRIGLVRVEVYRLGRPLVLGFSRPDASRPTILIYGHYDVQPPDPLAEWLSPPFEPTIRGRYLHARGASDDKGQLFCHLAALERILETAGRLPVNVKVLIEGEEEIGSPSLRPFLERHRGELSADAALLSDSPMRGRDQPALTYGFRGALSASLEVEGPERDLHSGQFGGAVPNPAQALAEILARLHREDGRIAIPGFYDRVRHIGASERADLRRALRRDAQILHDAGVAAPWGEPGYSLGERITIRPALSINGITAGYQGRGVKAVIPSRASAKLNLRLVPDQDPRRIDELLRRHIEAVAPAAVRVRLRTELMARPVVVSRRHRAMTAAARAYRRGFGVAPVMIRSGGTIPAVSLFHEVLGIPTVPMGFALPDDRMHAPNERLHLPTFFKGVRTSACFLEEAAKLLAPSRVVAGATHRSTAA